MQFRGPAKGTMTETRGPTQTAPLPSGTVRALSMVTARVRSAGRPCPARWPR